MPMTKMWTTTRVDLKGCKRGLQSKTGCMHQDEAVGQSRLDAQQENAPRLRPGNDISHVTRSCHSFKKSTTAFPSHQPQPVLPNSPRPRPSQPTHLYHPTLNAATRVLLAPSARALTMEPREKEVLCATLSVLWVRTSSDYICVLGSCNTHNTLKWLWNTHPWSTQPHYGPGIHIVHMLCAYIFE